ncbi:rod shape-determining protein MreD [Streptomyces sp. Ru73]|uniref:rod shape-determining protein MreD n=1 Tax=Streptomyces sp. Ru73 TaxID=2080748 RepID=UPI000CDD0381|nr:rod shape-determining protein MreD [Streptomyces sp. Ru73]POX38125.1 rod shape-determining protein MreD [Streptomyces sp. Ru73]
MRINRILLSTVLVAVALVVQVGVLARLHLPGAVPDLVLLVVLGLAMVYGHVAGAFIGFGAGLLADLAPPSDHAIGRYALVLCVIGYVAGLTKPDKSQHRSASMPLIVVVCAAIGSTLLYAGVGSLAGDNAGNTVGIPLLLFTATVYDLVLAPFSVPLVMALARRSEKDPLAGESSGGTQSGMVTGEAAYGWLSTGSGLRMSRPGRGGRTPRIGSQRGGLLGGKSKSLKAVRIKGGKRL